VIDVIKHQWLQSTYTLWGYQILNPDIQISQLKTPQPGKEPKWLASDLTQGLQHQSRGELVSI
jgi:hypothetical protein